MRELAFIIGIAAVALYLIGYLQKKRKTNIKFKRRTQSLFLCVFTFLLKKSR